MDTKLIQQLKRHEGLKNHAYQDHLGFWTIGYGRLIDQRKGGRITDEEAEYLLTSDVVACLRDMRSIPAFCSLDHVRQSALVNMRFQLGAAGIRAFKRMWAALDARDYALAEAEALNSRWASQTSNRAKEIARQLRTGEWQE